MNDMLKNMMDEVTKNYESMKSFDLTKSFAMPKDWDSSNVSNQIIDFQKNIFNNSYNTIVKIQEQTEKMTDTFLAGNTSMPAEGRKVLDEWKVAVKKGQVDFKKQIDDGFEKLETFISQSKKSTTTAAPKEKAK